MKNLAGKSEYPVTRREFTRESALALLSGVAITIVGCGSDSSTSPSPPSSPPTDSGNSVTGTVSANHGHVAIITGAQLTAGGMLSLDITGNADHPHTVELSDSDLTQIRNGQRVSKASTTNSSHDHTVTFN